MFEPLALKRKGVQICVSRINSLTDFPSRFFFFFMRGLETDGVEAGADEKKQTNEFI